MALHSTADYAFPSLQEIARLLGGDVSGNHVLAPGPGHSPKDRSMSVKIEPGAPDGFLVYTHSPSDDPIRAKDYVRSKIGMDAWRPGSQANGNGYIPKSESSYREVANYDYRDESGTLLFRVVRLESGTQQPKKFRQCRPNGNGGWIHSIGETRRVLYRLPEITEAIASEQPIFIAEGEKAVDALVSIGVQATCSPGGARKWRDEYSKMIAGADVVVLPDNDAMGELHREAVVSSIKDIAARVRALRLPDIPPKGDAYDWVQSGGTAQLLWDLLQSDDGAEPQDNHSPGLVINCAADIEPEKLEWLWQDRLPRGKNVLIAGEGGLGKSMLLTWIAATISRGGEWPCGEGVAPLGSVIILSAEDDAADTIVPRLIAADADLHKIYIVPAVRRVGVDGQQSFNLQLDLPALEQKIAEIGDVLCVQIDPVTSYLGKVDSHKNAEHRSVLEPLGALANRCDVTIICNTHFSKASGGSANNRVIGSVAFVNQARAAHIVSADPEDKDRRLFLPSKSNLGKRRDGLAYRITETAITAADGTLIWAPYVKWEPDTISMSADEAVTAMSGGAEGRTAKSEAMDFLRDELAAGPVAAAEIQKEARAAGHTPKALRSAREALAVVTRKVGLSEGWVWELPKVPNTPEGAHHR